MPSCIVGRNYTLRYNLFIFCSSIDQGCKAGSLPFFSAHELEERQGHQFALVCFEELHESMVVDMASEFHRIARHDLEHDVDADEFHAWDI
ncbi:hypothetical protein GUJ93_ZPchr0007g3662 [Zizania palustris]|uniref:Uncharacterized protein n=1 Tax=Zizania palustris TaxID=103762 RepID=A0A8J5SUR3_ZIZPA|nr:hypothetical protein GUJ93_ZPchr0007g3662 [Zizania palustris]